MVIFEKDNKREVQYMTELHRQRTNEFMLKAYGYVFELFRLTQEYALKNDIKIYNATKGGTLDVFPRIKYEELFNEKISNLLTKMKFCFKKDMWCLCLVGFLKDNFRGSQQNIFKSKH